MNDGQITEDLILLHGDVKTEHISSLRSILVSDNVYSVTGPKEYVFPGKVQVIIRISQVIDFHEDLSLQSVLNVHCKVFRSIIDYFRNLGREVDYYGFDILFDYFRMQFTILFVAPKDYLKQGLSMLEKDIPELASQPHSGCIKFQVTPEGQKSISDCNTFKDLYRIEEYFT